MGIKLNSGGGTLFGLPFSFASRSGNFRFGGILLLCLFHPKNVVASVRATLTQFLLAYGA
jgi:hypothetical protein